MSLRAELARKAFHCLSLLYLALYHLAGRQRTLWLLGAWTLAVGGLERWRLANPEVNARLIAFFGGIHRAKEEGRMSGVWWTSLGCWLTFLLYGGESSVADAAVLYLTFGDMAAALAGKAWGQHPFIIGGRRKSVEGSLACFLACLACGAAAGLSVPAIFAGAVAATLVEMLPLPYDDNLWMPLAGAAAIEFLR